MASKLNAPCRPHSSSKPALVKAIISLMAAVAVVVLLTDRTAQRPPLGFSPVEKQAVFEQSVTPVLTRNAAANAAALESLQEGIHALFDQYRGRVPAFTKDITGLGNKSQMVWDSVRELVTDDTERVQRHVTGKFEMHVVSADAMQRDIETLVHAFQRDIEANRNLMLCDIEAAVSDHPGLGVQGVKLSDTFSREIQERLAAESRKTGRDAMVVGGLTLVVSFAVEEAVRVMVTSALVRVGASMAASMGTTAAAAGGATAAGGAGGGAVGTAGGPAGVAAGVVVGIAAGFAVDWVMSERMETKLTDECRNFLTKVETGLTERPDGLVAATAKALAELQRAQSSIIEHQLGILP